jgi:hypothetical protein
VAESDGDRPATELEKTFLSRASGLWITEDECGETVHSTADWERGCSPEIHSEAVRCGECRDSPSDERNVRVPNGRVLTW